jgi:L-fuculose-phosphate aldolase
MSSVVHSRKLGAPVASTNDQPQFDERTVADLYEKSLALRQEIVDVARKLWLRKYVDGNAGNISCRLTEHYLLCTPTMISKGDVGVEDICLLDMDGQWQWGGRPTSEILLHLAMYRANPVTQAIVHCHPPHATAYAITGTVPPSSVLAEADLFIGPIAMAPYETPGTHSFADSVMPLVREHNAIILANHGVVCWANTVTHAEWCVEVLDGYCHMLILAAQLGRPLVQMPMDKVTDLLEIKKRLGLPDARFDFVDQPQVGRCWNF